MNRPLHVLLLEDPEEGPASMGRDLREHWPDLELRRVERRLQFAGAFAELAPDIVLADYGMPDVETLDALGLVLQRAPTVPFLLVSDRIGDDVALWILRAELAASVPRRSCGRLVPTVQRLLEDAERRKALARAERESRELRLVEERFRALMLATRDGFYDVQTATSEVWVNDNLRRILGLPLTAPAPNFQEWRGRVHADDLPAFLAVAGACPGTGDDRWSLQYRLRRGDGSYVPVLDRGFVVGDVGGEVRRVVGAITEITEVRHLEQQLRQAQKMEAVGRLAGGVAHDFNNLLTVINGYGGHLLQHTPEADARRPAVEEMLRAGERAAGLTRQLLTFSRRTSFEPRLINVNRVLGDMKKMLGRMIGEDVRLEFDASRPIGSVRVDPGQFEQVIMNLVVNARDAMPRGGTIRIATYDQVLDERHVCILPGIPLGSMVCIAVRDNGSGMSDDTKSHLFEPFFTTKGVGKGTGLGLSTVYGIVRQAMGHMEVDSTPEQGSEFRVYFPRVETTTAEPGSPSALPAAGGHETVLLVEDEDAVRMLARELLEDRGYRVLEAANGAEALNVLTRHPEAIHLLLTDSVMPGMSGGELAQRLKTIRPATRVLLMSGYTDERAQPGGSMRGMFFLQKPFGSGSLSARVREALDAPVTHLDVEPSPLYPA